MKEKIFFKFLKVKKNKLNINAKIEFFFVNLHFFFQ